METTTFDFGTAFGLASVNQTAKQASAASDFSEVLDKPDSMAFLRVVVKAAADFLGDSPEYQDTPAYRHLKRAATMRDPALHPHLRELYREVCSTCLDMDKQASFISGVAAPLGFTAKGLGYGVLGAGVGSGALYWLLSRHTRQGNAEVESLKQQRDYYEGLRRRLKDRMDERYQYGDSADID